MNEEELEQYELVIEEQAYPFEDKAINVHEKNMELLDVGIYNEWIDKSIVKLAALLPARYGKTEQEGSVITLIQPGLVDKSNVQKEIAKEVVINEENIVDDSQQEKVVDTEKPEAEVDGNAIDEQITSDKAVGDKNE